MSLRFTSVVVVLLVNLLAPAPAAAQFWDVIRWFNDMSGPQMLGFSVDIPVACRYDDGNRSKLFECTQFRLVEPPAPSDQTPAVLPIGAPRSFTISGRAGYLASTKRIGNNEDVERAVSAAVFGVGATQALIKGRPPLQVDGVAALDFVRFRGPSVDDFWVPTANVGVAFRYGGTRHRSAFVNGIRASIRYQKFFDTFGGEKFAAAGAFESKREGILQFTVGWILF